MFKLFHNWKTQYTLWRYNRILKHNYQLIENCLLDCYNEIDVQECWKIVYTKLLRCIRFVCLILLRGGPNAQHNALKWKKLKAKIISCRYANSLLPTNEILEEIFSEVDNLLKYHSDLLLCLKAQENSPSHS
ncbi:MAG: hypothetical protein HFJ29_05700 [Clostridia bacterium]|nr:hypothetical protein [Clostridia bacterium]